MGLIFCFCTILNLLHFFQASIFEAVNDGDYNFFEAILDDPKVNAGITFNHLYENGDTLLHTAVEKNRPDFLKSLLRNGADVNQLNSKRSTCLQMAARQGSFSCLHVLLHTGQADPNAAMQNGETILHLLAKKCLRSHFNYMTYVQCLEAVLRTPGVDVDPR